MLNIYYQVFQKLNQDKVDYCIYKGLSHLEEDLNGDRGDIDILIDKTSLANFEHALSSNFKKVLSQGFPHYYFGLDLETHKFTMIDADNKLRLGDKPYKYYSYLINGDKLKKILNNGIWVIDKHEYIPLFFLQKITMQIPKDDDLLELKTLLMNNHTTYHSYIATIVENLTHTSWKEIKQDIVNAKDWEELQKTYQKEIVKKLPIDYRLYLRQRIYKLENLIRRVKTKVFKTPSYKIRKKGHLVVFIGVDGAGKSSTVDYLTNIDYFKYTGIKRIYFGNNEYWIPGVSWGLNTINNKWLKILFALLAHTDKSLRSLIAFFYIKRGYIVVADRFYYDDFIGDEMRKDSIQPTKSIVKKIYRKVFEPKIWIEPDLTIFLDVSPEVAYSRKQDYSYEMMLEVNKAYKIYMSTVTNVVTIDADQNQEDVYHKVVEHVLELDKR